MFARIDRKARWGCVNYLKSGGYKCHWSGLDCMLRRWRRWIDSHIRIIDLSIQTWKVYGGDVSTIWSVEDVINPDLIACCRSHHEQVLSRSGIKKSNLSQFVTMILLQTTKKKKKQKKYTHEWSQIAENSFFPEQMGRRRRLNLLSLWEVGSQLWRIFSKRSKSFKMKLVVWRRRRRKGRRDILLHRHSHLQPGTSPRIDSNIPQEHCRHVRPEDLTILFSSPLNLHYHIHHVRLTSRQKTLFSPSSLFCHVNFSMCTYVNSRPNSNKNEKNLFVL